jgi:6-phosphogluconolactonase
VAIVERFCSHAADLVQVLAAEIVGRLTGAVEQRGIASFVATGGTSPGGLYDAMSKLPAPWEQVQVTLSDERWVAPGDEASNERLVRERLLVGHAAAARYVALKTSDATPRNAERAVGRAIEAMPRPFDVTLLGMGSDGHVASLFPLAPELTLALKADDPAMVRAVHRPDAAGAPDRLSMTRRALLDSRGIVLLIEGAEKLAVYRRAHAGRDPFEMPIRLILDQSRAPVQIWWAP